jgi:ABC-2 type transport system permease protein
MSMEQQPEGRGENLMLENKVPSSLTQIGIQVKYEFLNYFRSRRFFILLAIGVVIGLLLTAVVGDYRPASYMASSLSFYSSWWGTAATYIVILSGIFFGGDAISGEFQNKTGYYLVPNPIRRSSIYVGKWIAAFLASSTILGIFAAITIANGAFYFGATNIPYQFGESLLFSLVYLVSILGFTFFFSSLFKSSTYSILITAILLLFGFQLVQALVSGLTGAEPWFVLTYGASIIGNILSPTGYPAHVVNKVPSGDILFRNGFVSDFNSTIPEGIAIMLVYFGVTAILGLVLFEKKEFN